MEEEKEQNSFGSDLNFIEQYDLRSIACDLERRDDIMICHKNVQTYKNKKVLPFTQNPHTYRTTCLINLFIDNERL
jgi:hypothetical protein